MAQVIKIDHKRQSGKLFAIEGIDGSGKATNTRLLAKRLKRAGWRVATVSFPNYQGFFGRMIKQLQIGAFGRLDRIDPRFLILLYALDRLDSKSKLIDLIARHDFVLADRYCQSNIYNVARASPAKRASIASWADLLEYKIFKLPRPVLNIYLRLPLAVSQSLRSGRKGDQDLNEIDSKYLKTVQKLYDQRAKTGGWLKIEGVANGQILTPIQVNQKIYQGLKQNGFV